MNRLLTAAVAAAALWAAACGSGGGTLPPLPPPSGKYSKSSLNGTYAFVTSGSVFNGASATSFSRTGSFTADGNGNITGGVYDVNSSGLVTPAILINTGSKYTVTADGRGTLTFNVNSPSGPASINFSIVLTSTSNGLIMDETSPANGGSQASTGSGNFIKQNTALFQTATVNGTYTFDFSGLDATQLPLSIVGEIGVAGGSLTGGFDDANDFSATLPTRGSIPAGGGFGSDPSNPNTLTSNGRGIVTIASETYAFYIVDGTRVRLISSSNTGQMLTGDIVVQANTVPTTASAIGPAFAFLIAGSTGAGGITRVGRFSNAAGTLSSVNVDTNNGGQLILTNGSSGTIAADAANPGIPGRFLLTINNGGAAAFTAVLYFSSSTSGVMQETTVSNNATVDVADGSFNAQTGTFSSSTVTGPYAFNWSGLTIQNGQVAEEDALSQVAVTNLSLSGATDLFEFTDLTAVQDILTSGSVTISGDGTTSSQTRNAASVKLATVSSPVTFVVYFVNPQLAYIASNATTRIAAGIVEAQQ